MSVVAFPRARIVRRSRAGNVLTKPGDLRPELARAYIIVSGQRRRIPNPDHFADWCRRESELAVTEGLITRTVSRYGVTGRTAASLHPAYAYDAWIKAAREALHLDDRCAAAIQMCTAAGKLP